jgi:CRISPR-associated protein Csb2
MTTIELKFPAHRFHATPWGRHVNEGVPEWPPSPYRLLRALYDAWKRKHPEIPEQELLAILQALAREAPGFLLPRATASHTRSYLHTNTFDPTDKTLIFDAFVAVPRDAKCYLRWDHVELADTQRQALHTLLASLNYMGRSESWVEAALVDGQVSSAWRCDPLDRSTESGEAVPVACAIPPDEYKEKRQWLDALAYSTTELLKDRRSGPPAMRLVHYVRPPEALSTRITRAPAKNKLGIQAVMLALDSPVLPLVTATLEVAEQVRTKLMGIHKRIVGDPSWVSPRFSGKNPDGSPLAGHQHTFILPLGNDRGRITRILLFSRLGFNTDEIRAILELRELYRRGSDKAIRVVTTWQGRADDPKVRPPSRTVHSVTPFVPPRHWRPGRDEEKFLLEEIQRECANHGLPKAVQVERLEHAAGLFEWVEFRRNRKEDPGRPGYGFRIGFAEAVPAPFSLGYACHFGLGQFAPE